MATPVPHPTPQPAGLQSVKRALGVLDALARHPDGTTPKGLSAELGLHLSTTYHLLNTLVAAGYVARCPASRLFQLGPRVPGLNHAFLASLRPSPGLLPFLQALQQATGETVHLARLRGDDAIIVALVEGSRPDSVPGGYVGCPLPAHAVAIGRALLAWAPAARTEAYLTRGDLSGYGPFRPSDARALRAELTRLRAAGYAVDPSRGGRGVVGCVAAPVVGVNGEVVEAMSVVAPRKRFEREEAALVAAVLAVTRAASALAGGAPEVGPPGEASPEADRRALRAAVEALLGAAPSIRSPV